MGKFSGKKLLILGSSVGSVEMVEYARREGAWVIVTDYLPTEKSAAKKVADETAMVSTIDVDALCDFVARKQIDGIFCGVSEMNLVSMEQVARRMGLPCYFTKEQWDICQHKARFKSLCRQYGVPVPADYTQAVKAGQWEKLSYPVIVKPVDSSAGRGIRICHSKEEVEAAWEYALTFSASKTVLVEAYVTGDEITATYTLKNGEVSLSCLKDKLLSYDHPNITSQGDVLMCPSSYLQRFVEEVDPYVHRFLKGIGAANGTVFIQGIANREQIVMFEMGYRINGAADYRHVAAENQINFMEMMVAYALTGEMEGYELSQDNPFFSKYVLTFNIWGHGGTIGAMSGLEEVLALENVVTAEYMHTPGDTVKDDNTLSQRVFRALIAAKKVEDITKTIRNIQSLVKVTNTVGEDMCYLPFDTRRLTERYFDR